MNSPVFHVGRITLSDRASAGVYPDASGPEIERVLAGFFDETLRFTVRLLPDEQDRIEAALRELAALGCSLIVTTGGTGPAPRDVTPEATRAVISRELPGFGEIMRLRSHERVPTAILTRATAGILSRSLVVNLPGRPTAIAECLPLLVPAIAECLEHVAGWRPRVAGQNRVPPPPLSARGEAS